MILNNSLTDAVAIICTNLTRLGWTWDWDKNFRAWVIETPIGWRVAEDSQQLVEVWWELLAAKVV